MTKKSNPSKKAVTARPIESLIQVIRGQKVMVDADLAALYGVPTGALNQTVRRNIERFPEDFAFQLSRAEFEHWKSQFVISNPAAKMGLRRAPLVFTQEGVAMLSTVLRSDRAVQMSIAIVRTFVRMRELMELIRTLPGAWRNWSAAREHGCGRRSRPLYPRGTASPGRPSCRSLFPKRSGAGCLLTCLSHDI
jgi:hypothetical protein